MCTGQNKESPLASSSVAEEYKAVLSLTKIIIIDKKKDLPNSHNFIESLDVTLKRPIPWNYLIILAGFAYIFFSGFIYSTKSTPKGFRKKSSNQIPIFL